jgi:hypothetical protein
MTGTGRHFFFKTVHYPFHTHARLGYTGTGTREFLFFIFFSVFVCCFWFFSSIFILQYRKISIIYFRLSTNLNVHFKRIIYFINVHLF